MIAKTTNVPGKRTRLLTAAERLVYQQGFNQTTLADIAQEAEVPLGNVYYYFKTKEAIGEALIRHRCERYRALRESWDRDLDPKNRLLAFIQMTSNNREMLAQSGCPIGSLCQELRKEDRPLAHMASSLFTELLAWLKDQFRLLGKGRESKLLAVHVLSVLQGASLLTHALGDPDVMLHETARLARWLETL